MKDFFMSTKNSALDRQYAGHFLATYVDEKLVAASFFNSQADAEGFQEFLFRPHPDVDRANARCRSPDVIDCHIFVKHDGTVFREKLRHENVSINLVLNSLVNRQVPDHA
jgi:hypothetical protein